MFQDEDDNDDVVDLVLSPNRTSLSDQSAASRGCSRSSSAASRSCPDPCGGDGEASPRTYHQKHVMQGAMQCGGGAEEPQQQRLANSNSPWPCILGRSTLDLGGGDFDGSPVPPLVGLAGSPGASPLKGLRM